MIKKLKALALSTILISTLNNVMASDKLEEDSSHQGCLSRFMQMVCPCIGNEGEDKPIESSKVTTKTGTMDPILFDYLNNIKTKDTWINFNIPGVACNIISCKVTTLNPDSNYIGFTTEKGFFLLVKMDSVAVWGYIDG